MKKPSQGSAVPEKLYLQEDFPLPSYEEWRAAAEELLKGASFEKVLLTPTDEGITLRPIYRPEDIEKMDFTASWPGFPPHVRESRAAGYRESPWDIAQALPYSSPGEFNHALRHDLERGQSAAYLRLDTATRIGEDSDAGQPETVGNGGLTLSTADDLETALAQVDLRQIPLYLEAGASGALLGAFLIHLCEKRETPLDALRGAIESDPLGELALSGQLPATLEALYDEMHQLTLWAVQEAPQLQTVGVRTDIYHDAGAHAVQELAFAMAIGTSYLRALLERGTAIDDAAPRLRFTFALGSHFFMEIAKLRAARLLWSNVVKAFGGNARAQRMVIHARTAHWNKTVYDPYVNLLRTTTEAFSGIVGGCDSLQVGTFDEMLGLPNEYSRRLARNTQLILKEEAHLDKVIDPAGGSWYVEALTAELAERAWKLFQELEKQGGFYKALRDGFPQAEAARVEQERIDRLAHRRDKLVGINVYANVQEKRLRPRLPDRQAFYEERKTALQAFRNRRDPQKVADALELLREQTRERKLDMEGLISAVRAGATLGELREARQAGGGKRPQVPLLELQRGARIFEELRQALETRRAQTGRYPLVFLTNFGKPAQYRGRADFSRGFFEIAGFEVRESSAFSDPNKAAGAVREASPDIVVICSSDDYYTQVVEPFAGAVKQIRTDISVVLAGHPGDQREAYTAAGVDVFIHLRSNVYETLRGFLRDLQILDA